MTFGRGVNFSREGWADLCVGLCQPGPCRPSTRATTASKKHDKRPLESVPGDLDLQNVPFRTAKQAILQPETCRLARQNGTYGQVPVNQTVNKTTGMMQYFFTNHGGITLPATRLQPAGTGVKPPCLGAQPCPRPPTGIVPNHAQPPGKATPTAMPDWLTTAFANHRFWVKNTKT